MTRYSSEVQNFAATPLTASQTTLSMKVGSFDQAAGTPHEMRRRSDSFCASMQPQRPELGSLRDVWRGCPLHRSQQA
jgi:hypothetical protein